MSAENAQLNLPNYANFVESIATLSLNFSASTLHGMMCGYLCAGADSQGEAYIQALLHNKKDKLGREAILALFSVYSISQQQINNFDFEFELLIPDDNQSLFDRAQAFTDWCGGFTQSMAIMGVSPEQFDDEESQEALQHLIEFAELDNDSLEIEEEDEKALMEVSEYARMAVLRLHSDLVMNEQNGSETTH
jgi:uncharacterized protein YgfB (UPF0149 family)